jgi:signal transduction histidine kinase
MENQQQSTILVVDDNELNRDLVKLQLSRLGYQVCLADSGVAALQILHDANIDLVLLDLRMPGMSGMEVLQKIRQQFSLLTLPVIMVTADDQEHLIVEALRTGANDYLVKPLNFAVAVARIRAQLGTRDLSRLKDEFLSFASHDLKKPLIVMNDIIETMRLDIDHNNIDIDDIKELLQLLHKSAHNMQGVIENFLDTETINGDAHGLKLKQFNLNELVSNAIAANQKYAFKKGISLTGKLAEHLDELQADEFYITQILDNLIGNALKFSPTNSRTQVFTRQEGNFIYTEIRDTGPGLTEQDFQNLFQANVQLSNKPTGDESSSGIGLTLAKKLVDMHGGEIGARNNSENGATFWFKLPIKQIANQADKVDTKKTRALQEARGEQA